MSTTISPLAGKPAPRSLLVDVQRLLAAYVDLRPDAGEISDCPLPIVKARTGDGA